MQKELNKDYFLWKRFKGGDNIAFYQLYDEHVDSLFRFGIQFSKDENFVKDCIHDLFLDLYDRKNRLGDTDSIKFYLFRSLRRKIYKQQSKSSFHSLEMDEESDLINQTPAFEETLINSEIQKENINLLIRAVNQLTSQQQRALFLKFEQNLTYSEIAEILGISIESARTNIYRSLKTLREKISETKISINLLYLFFSKSNFDFRF
ncbi:MAG: sigma-70 family RNA polymerase sigma factor [Prolixibacteraceae bacterium]|jgi:RNA polymerase sigma factor (sigma-70 family)